MRFFLVSAWRRVVRPAHAATLGQILRFAISGVAAALTLMGTLYLLTEFAGLWYIHSVLIASGVSFFVSFGLQRLWTFRRAGQGAALSQLMAFATLFLANSAINAGLLYVMVDHLNTPYLLAELGIATLIAIWNFAIMRWLIFKDGAGRATP